MQVNTFFLSWEPGFMAWFQELLGPVAEKVMPIVSIFGEELVMVAVFAFIYLCYDKAFGVYLGTNIMAATVWNPLFKNIFLRARPYMVHSEIKCLKPVEPDADLLDIAAQGYSFPSGHSINAAACYGSIAARLKKRWITIVAVVISVLVAVSRFAVGVHYPTDVIVGLALGAIIILLNGFLRKKVSQPVLFLIFFLIAIPGWFYCKTNDFYTGFGMMVGFFTGVLFEERYVKFKNTMKWYRILLRIALGMGIFYGLNTVLKLPFPKEILEAGNYLAFTIRAVRYAIVIFVTAGVYPLSFRILDRVEEKKAMEKKAEETNEN